ncbi:MAG: transcription-repair coupling factor [Gammaproteobacteria bacterium]|nr:transcription-repair coupling factor [Gammaproteobacteria bacterium]
MTTLYELPSITQGVIVVPIQTLLQRIPPRDFILPRMFLLSEGEELAFESLLDQLVQTGYRKVETVYEHGEFAVRGSLLDFYPMGTNHPIRIDFFDDVVESVRSFDPDTQRSIDKLLNVQVMPAHEYPLDETAIARFRQTWNSTFPAVERQSPVYQDISDGKAVEGIECYLPLFFDTMHNLFDYVPENTVVVVADRVIEEAEEFLSDVRRRYETHRMEVLRPLLPPKELFLEIDQLRSYWNNYPRIHLQREGTPRKHSVSVGGLELPNIALDARRSEPARNARDFIANLSTPVLVTADTRGRLQHVQDVLGRIQIPTSFVESYDDFLAQQFGVFVALGQFQEGLWNSERVILTETQIFGERAETTRQRSRQKAFDPDTIIRNLTELKPGDPVVHIDHGVGRYVGLEKLSFRAEITDFVTIEYADKDRLYVPISSLDLISRYTGVDASHAPLHKLGSDAWAKLKRRAAKKIYDVAVELLSIYARRKATRSVSFPATDSDYEKFCDECEFELTVDQAESTDKILEDLRSTRATDRLVCGDVGFGKTEVAMRAAFHVVQAGFQVIVLVPTTILAQQHFETFTDRFANWPHVIELMSRFRTDQEVKLISERIAVGSVDIVIGTHKLLRTKVDFKRLGLLVIDEEHRFGVRDKERIKNFKAEVDTITLTATPIPRTLNLSMGGLRDLSLITTPPANRLAVKTFVVPYNPVVVSDAINRELARGGQVFYLHNKVQTIHDVYEGIKQLVPHARIDVGHGQMKKRELERVMSDFYHRKSNVLVCTTIIESGIDIPNANTIIIDRADKFGLAQLHQLRGRVGRSTRQAYAYLLTPDDDVIFTVDAKQRLDAIVKSDDLGSGFSLSMHDLEIRGAGEILGQQQHGQLESIGFTLYMQMLNYTVDTIKSGGMPNFEDPLPMTHEVNLETTALFPDDYIPNTHTRLVLYKRLASLTTQFELDQFKAEMIDRFGTLPDSAEVLFLTTHLKLLAQRKGVKRVIAGERGGTIEFFPDADVNPQSITSMVLAHPRRLKVLQGHKLSMTELPEDVTERGYFVEQCLNNIGLMT